MIKLMLDFEREGGGGGEILYEEGVPEIKEASPPPKQGGRDQYASAGPDMPCP